MTASGVAQDFPLFAMLALLLSLPGCRDGGSDRQGDATGNSRPETQLDSSAIVTLAEQALRGDGELIDFRVLQFVRKGDVYEVNLLPVEPAGSSVRHIAGGVVAVDGRGRATVVRRHR